jgi:hypothetical protein
VLLTQSGHSSKSVFSPGPEHHFVLRERLVYTFEGRALQRALALFISSNSLTDCCFKKSLPQWTIVQWNFAPVITTLHAMGLEPVTAAVAHRCGLGVGPVTTAVAHPRDVGLEPVKTAGGPPCDEVSLGGAEKAANLTLFIPVLVNPAARVRAG